MTLWAGRLEGGPAEALWAFTASLDVDRRLAADDVAGSRSHVRGLARAGLVSAAGTGTGTVAMVLVAGGMALALVPGLLTVTLPTSVHKRRGMSRERVWEAP